MRKIFSKVQKHIWATHIQSIICVRVDWPQDVSVIEFQQHVVLAKLCLPGAVGLLHGQVLVHFFETLKTLCHVLVVDLGIERWGTLLTQMVSAVHVEACALLNQRHRVWTAQVLLDDVLLVRLRKSWGLKSVYNTCVTYSPIPSAAFQAVVKAFQITV